jgi:hypothetical protein
MIEKSLKTFMSLKNPSEQLTDLSYYDFVVQFRETKAKSAKKIKLSSIHLTNGESYFIRRDKTALFLSMPKMKSDLNDLYSAWGLLVAHHKHFTIKTFQSWNFDDAVEILQREIAAKNMSSSLNKILYKLQLHDEVLDRTKNMRTTDANDNDSSHSSNNDDDDDNQSIPSDNNYDFECDQAPDDEDFSNVPFAKSLSSMDGFKNTSKLSYLDFKQAIDFIKFAQSQQQADSHEKLKQFDKTTSTNSPHFDELNCPTTTETKFYMKYEKLGVDQKQAFDVIAAYLLEQPCVKTESNPDGQLRLIVSGAAGTGKSKLIKAVVFYTRMQFGYGNTRYGPVLVVTVMGIAAFNAKGETIDRSCFVWQFGEHSEKNHNMIKKIQDSLSGIKLLIIDEMGTLGVYRFGKLNRIFQIAQNKYGKPFGGIHVILCGDFFQIPPVQAKSLFGNVDFTNKDYSESGFDCYRSFNRYKELTFNFRQQGTSENEIKFVDCLLRCRVGQATAEDADFLNTRIRKNMYDSEILKLPPNTLCVSSVHYLCGKGNDDHLAQLKVRDNVKVHDCWALHCQEPENSENGKESKVTTTRNKTKLMKLMILILSSQFLIQLYKLATLWTEKKHSKF